MVLDYTPKSLKRAKPLSQTHHLPNPPARTRLCGGPIPRRLPRALIPVIKVTRPVRRRNRAPARGQLRLGVLESLDGRDRGGRRGTEGMEGDPVGFMGVYDGHMGQEAALYAAQQMPKVMAHSR